MEPPEVNGGGWERQHGDKEFLGNWRSPPSPGEKATELERTRDAGRHGPYTYLEYARYTDDLVSLVDAHAQHEWLLKGEVHGKMWLETYRACAKCYVEQGNGSFTIYTQSAKFQRQSGVSEKILGAARTFLSEAGFASLWYEKYGRIDGVYGCGMRQGCVHNVLIACGTRNIELREKLNGRHPARRSATSVN